LIIDFGSKEHSLVKSQKTTGWIPKAGVMPVLLTAANLKCPTKN
jgi:hypothetical protein